MEGNTALGYVPALDHRVQIAGDLRVGHFAAKVQPGRILGHVQCASLRAAQDVVRIVVEQAADILLLVDRSATRRDRRWSRSVPLAQRAPLCLILCTSGINLRFLAERKGGY